jgi:hypothetical protein
MRRFLLRCALLVPVGACSYSVEVGSLNPFGSGEDPALPVTVPEIERDPVASVEAMEIGRGHRGWLVQATGYTDVVGYYSPLLRLRDGGRPAADGMIELEFVARPPEATSLDSAELVARRIIAAQFIPDDIAKGARGVRVLAGGNHVEKAF